MKVYNYLSQWYEGDNFEGSVYAKVFPTLEQAQAMLELEAGQAIESIKDAYGDYWEDPEDASPTHRLIGDSDEYQNDWWEGTITEQEL